MALEARRMVPKFYNTLTRKKETFRPAHGKRVRMFVCGPTVYDLSHIGHARTYIVFDVLARFLRHIGYDVFYLQNITDIDDKIIARAAEEHKTPKNLAREFEKSYYEDMKALGIVSVSKYARASDYIPEIIKQIERLIMKGFAYVSNGDVYFRVRKFKPYGRLSRQNIEALQQFEPGEKKEDPLDFALWKSSKPGEPRWRSPWASTSSRPYAVELDRHRGWGRPGWHIEDTAITEHFFGPQYDIHGGGIDLIFPHHECEIAQQEAASGKRPFVRYWLHTGHLTVDGHKMSKSLGNFITIREVLSRVTTETFRLLILSSHWRSPLIYSERLLRQAEAASQKLQNFHMKIQTLKIDGVDNMGTLRRLEKEKNAFYDALRDDLNTPKALAHLFTIVGITNPVLEYGNAGPKTVKFLSDFLKEVDSILGIVGKLRLPKIPGSVARLVRKREAFRREKKWHAADEIRRKLEKAGWIIEDTPLGSRVRRKSIG